MDLNENDDLDIEVTVDDGPPSLASFLKKSDSDDEEPAPAEEAKAEAKAEEKAAEPDVETRIEEAKKAQLEELTPLLREAHQAFVELEQVRAEVQEYVAVVELLQAERAQLMAALQEAGVIGERDAKLREYELQEQARIRETALEKARGEERSKYQAQLKAQKEEQAVEAQVQILMKEIPAALSKYELVSEDELCALIDRTPGKPSIDALAKQIHEAKLATAKKHLNAERRARVLPSATAGRRAPPQHSAKGPSLEDLMMRQQPGR